MPKPSLTIGARSWLAVRRTVRVQQWTPIQAFDLPLHDVPNTHSPPAGKARGE